MATKTTKMEFYVISNEDQSAFLGFRLDENLVMQPCVVNKLDDAAQWRHKLQAEYVFNHPGNHQFLIDNDLVYANKLNITVRTKRMSVNVPVDEVANKEAATYDDRLTDYDRRTIVQRKRGARKVTSDHTLVNGITASVYGITTPMDTITTPYMGLQLP